MIIDKRILREHIITEKSAILKDKDNKYVFRVILNATKGQIKTAVEHAFNVKVADVHTVIAAGKPKRMGRSVGKTQRWKKAIVKLRKGQVIPDFENA